MRHIWPYVAFVLLVFEYVRAQDDASGSCTPAALYALVTSNYETRIWPSLAGLRELETSCETSAYSKLYWANRAQLESFVGNYKSALTFFDRRQDRTAKQPAALPQDIMASPAVDYVARQAIGRQVVAVNERHHASPDRLLTLALLEPLAEQGFKYLAIEAGWSGDAVNERGYAIGRTGYYVNDVVFAELVRRAVEIGYNVVAYEQEHSQGADQIADESLSDVEIREFWQAQNIVDRVLRSDPNAKVLIHCGYGHMSEREGKPRVMMHFLKSALELDPLTVDQVGLSERSDPSFEHPWRVEAVARGLVGDHPVVLEVEDEQGQRHPLRLDDGGFADLYVVAPQTTLRAGRPSWMTMWGDREPVRVATPECSQSTCVVEAHHPEWPGAVPLDRVEATGQSSITLFLPRDRPIRVELLDLDQNVLARRQLSGGAGLTQEMEQSSTTPQLQ